MHRVLPCTMGISSMRIINVLVPEVAIWLVSKQMAMNMMEAEVYLLRPRTTLNYSYPMFQWNRWHTRHKNFSQTCLGSHAEKRQSNAILETQEINTNKNNVQQFQLFVLFLYKFTPLQLNHNCIYKQCVMCGKKQLIPSSNLTNQSSQSNRVIFCNM